MDNMCVSIIIPTRNVASDISNIIKTISLNNKGLNVEYIIIDMNSDDTTVLNSLKAIKSNNLCGTVLQNGNGTVGSALNSAIKKACGEYVTFVFPRTLYSDFIYEYYETAKSKDADFIFASSESSIKDKDIMMMGFSNMSGTDFAVAVIKSFVNINFSAVMFRREFILSKNIMFSETLRKGYAEQYIYKTILAQPKVAFCPKNLVRDLENQSKSIKEKNNDSLFAVFEHIDAMKEILELIKANYSDNTKLCDLFEFEKLPNTVLGCINSLLKSGMKPSTIKAAMRLKNYNELLVTSKSTPKVLRKRIFMWNRFPKLYKI